MFGFYREGWSLVIGGNMATSKFIKLISCFPRHHIATDDTATH